MFAELKMKLDCSELSYKMSSNLHGFIMETISSEYAEYLHQLQVNPFSQCLIKENNAMIWYIRTYTDEAYNEIVVPLLKVERFCIKRGKVEIIVKEKQMKTEQVETIMDEFYHVQANRYIEISFQTPTAFKSNGKYVFYPDLRLIFNSLMKRYHVIDPNMSMQDEDTLMQLIDNCEIVRYRLNTIPFSLEGVNITGFQGTICIRMKGTDTMARFVKLLFRIGEYIGVGIKTSLGMGAIKIKEMRGEGCDRSRN